MDKLVKIIARLKYEINNTLNLQEQNLMFQISYEDSKRLETLETPCTTEADIQLFASVLYTVVYEETKQGKVCKATLGGYNNHPFTYYVSELRHYYDHGFAEYVSTKKIKVSDVFKKYLKKAVAPKTAEEFQTIQRGILNDFIDFLNTINEEMSSGGNEQKVSVKGIIEKDAKGFLHCGDILLPNRYNDYVGHECKVGRVVKNTKLPSCKNYPYFAYYLASINADISGIIAMDDNICYCQNILLPDELKTMVGRNIKITVVKSVMKESNKYPVMAVKYKVVSKKKESKKSTKTASDIEPTIPLRERVKVEIDSDNLAHAGNVHIGAKKKCKKGDVVIIFKVGNNPTPEIAKKYPLVATELQKVVDNNGIAKIYTVAVDSKGILHADNLLLSPKTKCLTGDRIMILQGKENKDVSTLQVYPLYAAKFVVLNPEIPKVEEKATIIVSKFERYFWDSIKWLGDAIIAIIKRLLGKNNLILR